MTQSTDYQRPGRFDPEDAPLQVFDLDEPSELSRRRFLEAAGFSLSLAAVGGCQRAPVEVALPSPVQPVGAIPGRLQYFASTCAGCPSSCGLLIGTRDGRPLKMEGLPGHPLSDGGLCAVGQAQPIGLYDSHRLKGPLAAGKPAEWDAVDRAIIDALKQTIEQSGAVRFVSPTITSPTLLSYLGQFLGQFADAKLVILDPVSHSAILDAHEQTHAIRVLPHYRFDRAEVVVSFAADFLGTWISPVEFTAGWSKHRSPSEDSPQMSYHVQFESRMSLTGCNADRRFSIAPQEQGPLLAGLAAEVSRLAGQALDEPLAQSATQSYQPILAELAHRLWDARGESLVVCDSQSVEMQRVVNLINHRLGNYDSTLDLKQPSRQRQSNDREVEQLLEELKDGKVAALLVADVDLLHDLPGSKTLTDAIGKIPVTVSFAQREDEFAAVAKFVCPDHHALES